MTNVTRMCRKLDCPNRQSCLWYRARPRPEQPYYPNDALYPDSQGICNKFHHVSFAQNLRPLHDADFVNAGHVLNKKSD